MTNESNVREWTAVPAYAVAGLVAKGERLAKTAAKLGVPAPVVTVTNRRVRKIYDDILGDTGRTEAVADVTLSGLAPQLPGGWKVWGTVPTNLDGTLDSMAGRAVSFTAAVEASDDPTFGFYKRPTKAMFAA
jgi:hypothetical protein